LLYRFPGVVSRAASEYATSSVLISTNWPRFQFLLGSSSIIGGEKSVYRITLTMAVGQVLKNGLTLLGIKLPDKM
jgi:arginyl-tRNA synthetase